MSDLAAAFITGHVDQSIRELTGAIASGDTEAFERFYRQWFDAMYAEARRIGWRDEAFCLDIVHDAMLRVITSMKPMASEAALRGWLSRVVHSCACDQLRAEVRRRRREQTYAENGQAPEHADSKDLAERIEWLRRELASMDADASDLVAMRHRFGWTLKRIGRAVRRHPGVLHARLGRIMTSLRKRGQEKFDD